jgi:DNA-binding CsgD family transcriptional regulator/tetratricopeptide (TPR) repeat protein
VASALIWADRLEQAAAWLDRAVDDAARRGAAIAGAIAALNRATVHYHAGRLDDAIADGERALDVYHYGWTASPWSTPVLAATHLARGDLPAARAALAIGERADPRVFDYDLLLEARCRLRLATGDLDAALADALAVGERTISRAEVEQPRIWAWRRLAATAANGLGRRDEALRLIGRDLEILREIGPARQLGESLTVAGLVQGGAAGLDLLAEAVATLDASPARLQRTVSLLELGGALRRAGRRTTASVPLYEALALAAEIGSPGLEAKAREELRSLGLRPRRTAHRGVASLTGSERRVASLAADGLSTPQIAALLHVTRSTVETHLGHVYGKLGIAGRAELPAELTGSARPG